MSIVPVNRDEKDGNNVTSQDTCPLFKTMLSRFEAVVRVRMDFYGLILPINAVRSFITILFRRHTENRKEH